MVDVLASIDWGSLYIPAPVALGAVAVIGYLFGRRTRSDQRTVRDAQRAKRELRRAKLVAKELEKIAELVRTDLATHRESVIRFKDRVSEMSHDTEDASWQELCREAESILRPTLKLAAQISYAYDQIRQQTNHLMAFTEVRTDPLTGVSNRRGLDETLEGMFALLACDFRSRSLQADQRSAGTSSGRPHIAEVRATGGRNGPRYRCRGPLRRRRVRCDDAIHDPAWRGDPGRTSPEAGR